MRASRNLSVPMLQMSSTFRAHYNRCDRQYDHVDVGLYHVTSPQFIVMSSDFDRKMSAK